MNSLSNRNIRVNKRISKILSLLLTNEFESGGYLNNDESNVTSIEIYAGDNNAVHYPQVKPCGDNRITFHTHPRNPGTNHLSFLPPSIDDIISYTLANSYIYPIIKRTALVIGKEGVYTLQVIRKRKPLNVKLVDYLQETYLLLYSIWTYYNNEIWYNEKILTSVFDIIRVYFGVDIKFVTWENFHFIPLDYTSNSNAGEMKAEEEEFDRDSIAIHRNIFPNMNEENLQIILQEYENSLL